MERGLVFLSKLNFGADFSVFFFYVIPIGVDRFPVELHLVHKSVDGNITVVAVLYQFGRADPFLIRVIYE